MDIFTCKCGWEGTLEELATRWLQDPRHLGDVIPELACPECGSLNLELAVETVDIFRSQN